MAAFFLRITKTFMFLLLKFNRKCSSDYLSSFLTPAPKARVIVVACAVRVSAAAAAGINLVGVPQTKPMQ